MLLCDPAFSWSTSVWSHKVSCDASFRSLLSQLGERWSIQFRLYHMTLFHCKVSCHSTSGKVQIGFLIKVQIGRFLAMHWILCNTGSPSIKGAVIMKALVAIYIQFISFLVATTSSQLLQSYDSCLMPIILGFCCHCSTSLLVLGSSDSHSYFAASACPLFWAFASPYIQWLLLCMLG